MARELYAWSHPTYCARGCHRSGAYVVLSSRFTSPLQISAIILLQDITCKIVRTGNRTLLMTFFLSKREQLEASTKDSKVAGFKSVGCFPPRSRDRSLVWFFYCNQMHPTDKPMRDLWLCKQLPKWPPSTISTVWPPTRFSFWTQDRSSFEFNPCNVISHFHSSGDEDIT